MEDETMGDESSYEFYVDSGSEGNVLAISTETRRRRPDGLEEGFAATFDHLNSSVSWTKIDPSMLGDSIPEEKAREIHPRLFERLDRPES